MIKISSRKEFPQITIVVPAYNVEGFLERCLDSLAGQTRQNFRVVIVDDGSTDQTAAVCQRYAFGQESIFEYTYQENRGLGAARNKGLSLVRTPYVAFLDSDDWQDIRFVEKFEAFIHRLDFVPDMIFTLPKCYNEASHLLEDWMDKPLYDKLFAVRGGSSMLSLNAGSCPELYLLEVNANRKIYRTEFLRENVFAFPEGVKWEDIRPHIQLIHQAKSCVALPETGFIYRMNRAGQITAGTGKGRLDILRVFEDVLACVSEEQNVSRGLPGLPSAPFEEKEWSVIMELICNYTFWMIEMTNTEYIHALLEGLQKLFSGIPERMVNAYRKDADFSKRLEKLSPEEKRRLLEEKSKRIGLIRCLREKRQQQLLYYEDRQNLYRYWSVNGGKKKNLISGGIQCIRDSGLRYTVRLLFRKIIYSMGDLASKSRWTGREV